MEGQKGLISRRSFLKGACLAGGLALAAPLVEDLYRISQEGSWSSIQDHGLYQELEEYTATDVLYTMCHQCNTFCSIKVLLAKAPGDFPVPSIVRKIAGNPYSPLNTIPFGPLPYETSPAQAAQGKDELGREGRSFRGGRTCLKGQAGIQTVYDRFRLQKPLKRVGPRGSGRFKTISWEEAINEIVFGSPDLGTPGLKELWGYAPQEQVMSDWEKVKKGEMPQEEFDQKYREVLIDTRHPDLGPKANQIVCLGGDRRDFMRTRVWQQGLGSLSFIDHGGICGASSVIGNFRSFSGGTTRKDRLYPDLDHAEFVIIWGTNPAVANKGPTWLAPALTNALARGMKLAVVDPRYSKTAEKAHLWLPIKPGTDAALALGMARWIIENKRYDERYLLNPNPKAAQEDNEPTWTDATHLVNLSDPRRPKLRAKDLGIGGEQFVVIEKGKPVPHTEAREGTLEVDMEIQGIKVKSVFTLYRERVMEKTLEEYAKICGLSVQDIVNLAREWTSHGKRAAMMVYRGPAMHTNGYYTMRAINTLNHLIGNHDWKGGSITTGAKYRDFTGPRYDLLKVPKGLKPWGVSLVRGGAFYEKSSLFKRDGYPARRPWYPFGVNLSYEVLPSAKEGYPYPLKALFIYSMSIPLSMPQGWLQAEILKDEKAIPLLVVSDVVMGETALYADFVLPDLSYLERWQREAIYPNMKVKVSHVTQPVTRVVPEARSIEDVFIEILKKMNLPGVGPGAFPDGSSLDRSEDFYLKMVANIAYDEEPVPDASQEEMEIFYQTRRKALGPFFKPELWEKAVKPEEWRKVVYVLNRGGRFERPGKEYIGEHLKYRFAGQANFYDEGVAAGRDSYSGRFFDGLPRLEPVRSYNGEEMKKVLPLFFISWKARHIGTHRNIADAWLREIQRENYIWINPADALPRGLKTGDRVRIKSRYFEAVGRVLVTSGIRPGVVGTSYNYGTYSYGATPIEIDGQRQPLPPSHYSDRAIILGEPQHEEAGLAGPRNSGFSANNLLPSDPALKIGGLSDLIGTGAAQLDAWVEIEKY